MAVNNLQLRYDHPAFLDRQTFSGRLSGASGVLRFQAWTGMTLKQVSIGIFTAGTAADAKSLIKQTAAGALSTTILATTTAEAAGIYGTFSPAVTLAAGDMLSLSKGADATLDMAVAFELQITPGQQITS